MGVIAPFLTARRDSKSFFKKIHYWLHLRQSVQQFLYFFSLLDINQRKEADKKIEINNIKIGRLNSRKAVWRSQLEGKFLRRKHFSSEKHLLLQIRVVAFVIVFSGFAFKGLTQRITLSRTNVPLQTVFSDIEKQQTQYRFFYNESLLEKAKNVTIDVKNAPLEDVLNDCFRNQPVTYALVDNTIIVRKREENRNNDRQNVSDQVQKINISGKVTNSKGEPIAGATVSVKGTDMAIATDANGAFALANVEEDATLVVSSVAHLTQEIKLNRRNSLNISLQDKVANLDEAIVVAYNITTQRTNVGAVTVVKGEQIQALPNRSFDISLQGLVPGLLVTPGTGTPGGGVSNFVLRGITTAVERELTSTRYPLIVVDGVPVNQDHFQIYIDERRTPITNPLSQLNPSDIETLAVLKDAAAIALYGAKASNGVIVVTTKKGKSGKTVFNFRHQTDIATPLMGKVELLNQQEYLELLIESYKNFNSTLYPTDESVIAKLKTMFPTKVNGDFYPGTDWFDELYSDHAATISNELSMSGGNEKNNFYLNFGYTKQNGAIKKTGYDRKSLRFNFENRPANWLKLGLNTTFSYNVQDYGGSNRSSTGLAVAPLMSPLNPVRFEDGTLVLNYKFGGGPQSFSDYANPVALAEYNINRHTAFRSLNKLYAEISFLKHFKFNSVVGLDFMLAEAKEKGDPRLFDEGNFTIGMGRIQEQDTRRANIISTNMLRFDKAISKDHLLGVLIGQEAQILSQRNMLVGVRNLVLPYYDEISSPGVIVYQQAGSKTKETLLSYFSQANYSYKKKYFLTASIRRDGSSRFGEDKRYGTYWSAGAGWVVTEEGFMKKASSWLDYLKLRGSIGAAGNAASINRFTRFTQLNSGTFLGGIAVYPQTVPANPDVRWESTFTWDAGLEATFLRDRIMLNVDIYKKNTSDLIYSIQLPQNSGYNTILANIGEMENKGVEIALSGDIIRKKSFQWNVAVNWSTNRNKLVKANSSLPANAALNFGILANMEGKNFNSFYLPVWAGVNSANGAPQWIKDSTGAIVNTISGAQRQFVGKPQPDGFGSISNRVVYENFELSVMFYYQYGFQIFKSDDLENDGRFAYTNQDKRALNRWQKPGDQALNPKRILNNPSGSAVTNASTRYLFDGDYIRLKNVSVAYNFPKKVINHLRLSTLKIYIQAHNLAIWTKFPGLDPDNVNLGGSAGVGYPGQRSLSFGLNAGF